MSDKHPFTWRPPVELWTKVEARAEEKGLSVNEWLNRCVTHGLTVDGKTVITIRAEF